jgi:Flp pilus assembly protein TadB
MARGRGGRPSQQIRGFRPGKEPPQLRKQRAREQLPEDANWAQKRLAETMAGQSPEETRAMMRKWRIAMLAITIVLVVLGAALYLWSLAAGIVVHVLAAAAFFFWFRLHRQRQGFEAMADQISGRKPR